MHSLSYECRASSSRLHSASANVSSQVLHGASNDVMWLQRDFRVYLVNVLDTAACCQVTQDSSKLTNHTGRLWRCCTPVLTPHNHCCLLHPFVESWRQQLCLCRCWSTPTGPYNTCCRLSAASTLTKATSRLTGQLGALSFAMPCSTCMALYWRPLVSLTRQSVLRLAGRCRRAPSHMLAQMCTTPCT